ncbi:toll/interleukin-1 receptor domain-containing protein [Micromonospora taraxaci]|uniref:toll/interleukin-1 receptor domain-containing protein n=1 Tax=Micromonospora taraxaci TaxID=1316803 RepID=UPI0033F21567
MDDAGVPSPGRWLKQTLEGQKMSRAGLARLIGRSREEVQRWTSERENVPRHHLAEAAVQLGAEEDLRYVLLLKDCEDVNVKLLGQVREFARRTGCSADGVGEAIVRLARGGTTDAGHGAIEQANTYLRRLTDAQFVFRTLTEAATKGDVSQLLSNDNVHRHLRHPVNHFLGLGLDLAVQLPAADVGILPEFRDGVLGHLRRLAESRPTVGPEELTRHHAVHMLGRHGATEDRALVQEVVESARRSADPLGIRLGYMGLIMRARDPEIVEQYLSLLARDRLLARADINFDAVHYGDIVLRQHNSLPVTIDKHDRLAASIMDRLEQPDVYGFMAELDSLRLSAILEHSNGQAFRCPGATMRMLRICGSLDPPAHGSHRQHLEKRLFSLADDVGIDVPFRQNGSKPMTTAGIDKFDVFIGYNSHDRSEVLHIVDQLQHRGVRTWVDVRDLPPGRPFQDEIERILASCRSVALFVGADGSGPWERMEIKAAVSQYVKRGLPIIPVMLDGTGPDPRLPIFLSEFRMVRFSPAVDVLHSIDELVWGITGVKHQAPASR